MKQVFIGLLSVYTFLSSVPCCAEKIPKIWNISDGSGLFVGRGKIISDIHSFFKNAEHPILALTGGPGFGKTQIANQYAQQFYNYYDVVWWIDSQQDINSQLVKLAGELNQILTLHEQIPISHLSQEALIDRIKNELRIKPIKYLLIFDNVKTYAQIEKFVPYTHKQMGKDVLLTSRNANVWHRTIAISKFSRTESLEFGRIILPQEKMQDITKLAEVLGDYPLGLSLAFAFIKVHPTMTINRYMSLYLKKKTSLPHGSSFISETARPLLGNYSHGVEAALWISLKFIRPAAKVDILVKM
jgi:NB-ARC domain-containing protein